MHESGDPLVNLIINLFDTPFITSCVNCTVETSYRVWLTWTLPKFLT